MSALSSELIEFEPAYQFESEALVFSVPEMPDDELVRYRAAKFVGACTMQREVEIAYITESPINSLYEALGRAAEGDEQASSMVWNNVATDVIERTMKSGHITKTELTVDAEGNVGQAGHGMESIQANSLRYSSDLPQMRERTEAEIANAFRISHHYRAGNLEDYSFVVISRAADNMSTEQMDEIGFFTETMSTSIQVTSQHDGALTLESAFVAGVQVPGAERHDAEAVTALGDKLGVDLAGKTATETLATPLLIHNSLIPNGVIDLVKLYDECVDNDSFFGEAKPKQDYLEYRELCSRREANLKPVVNNIVTELIDEASTIKDEVEACQRLSKLSGAYMVVEAVNDETINPRVFGHEAAASIMAARHYAAEGNIDMMLNYTRSAQRVQRSSSCPSALKSTDSTMQENGVFDAEQDTPTEETDKYGSLTFTCSKGHPNRRPRNKLIDNCRVCGISVRC